jgi:hypothetical protein
MISMHRVLSLSGHWSEARYLATDDTIAHDDAAARELAEVMGRIAARSGDSVLVVTAYHPRIQLGVLWQAGVNHSMPFVLRDQTWTRM